MAIPKFQIPKSVLITGGTSGIGKAFALLVAQQNASLFLVGRDPVKLDRTIDEIQAANPNCQVSGCSASVSDSDALQQAVESAESEHGSVDLLVNSAGMSLPGYFEELDIEDFSQQIDTNYLGTVRAIQAVLPGMKANGYGWILNVSSVAGFKGFFGYTAYSGSKFAVVGLSEALRSEMERFNIGVTLLCPPDTRTPMLDAEESSKPIETKRLAASGTVLESEDVARAAWQGLQRSKFWVTPGLSANMLRIGNRFAPNVIDWMVRRTIRG